MALAQSSREDRTGETALVAALRNGDEGVFRMLVERHTPAMRRLALTFVRSHAVADEVVQEAWLGVLRGIDRFEERSSLKTWIFRIVANVGRSRGVREARSAPFSSFASADEPSVDPDRFQADGAWISPPEPWERLEAGEMRRVIGAAIAALPSQQRQVISLRDLEGWDADEVASVLEISEGNQRVLLHRARSKVRAAVEEHERGAT
jgi:RNA polymerase sigma-70 factor (ECF subfamily)